MIGIPYIKALFGAILGQSKVIQGRFHMCPFWGNELNKINIAEITQYVEEKKLTDQKYPAALLMPIKSVGNFQFSGLQDTGYTTKEINLVFVTKPYTTGQNQTFDPLPNGMPQHDIPDTWHDMERCAIDFLAVLHNVIEANNLQGTVYISEQRQQEIFELSGKSNDMVSGVLLRFYLGWYTGCEIDDYLPDYLETITAPPVTDTHPSHPM